MLALPTTRTILHRTVLYSAPPIHVIHVQLHTIADREREVSIVKPTYTVPYLCIMHALSMHHCV